MGFLVPIHQPGGVVVSSHLGRSHRPMGTGRWDLASLVVSSKTIPHDVLTTKAGAHARERDAPPCDGRGAPATQLCDGPRWFWTGHLRPT
jgi:hypothetical protein